MLCYAFSKTYRRYAQSSRAARERNQFATLPSEERAACDAGQQQLVEIAGAPPQEPLKLGPTALGAVVLLLMLGAWALANRKQRPLQLPGACMRLPLIGSVYALLSRKNRKTGVADELDAKDGD